MPPLAQPVVPPTMSQITRAFRRWADSVDHESRPAVAGAEIDERARLGALGGLAAAVAGLAVAGWSAPLREWADSGPKPPDDLIDSVCEALGRGYDPLSVLYNASISAENRRRLGTVFTPPSLVQHMLRLASAELRVAPRVIVDPGAGVGAFTIAAALKWPRARIVAVDINVVTLGLLAARIAFEGDAAPETAARLRRIELVFADYLDELENLYTEGAPGPILALGNPPYTRVQQLPSGDREKAAKLAGEIIDSGHANLAMLFQAATFRHMRPDDVSCMVLPGSFSYTRAGRALRTALWRSQRPIEVQRTPATVRAFTGRAVQAAVLVVGTERSRRAPLRLARVQVDTEAVEVLDAWTLSRTDEQPDNWFWHTTAAGDDHDIVRLGDVAIVRRGTATGANEMFFLTDRDIAALPSEVIVRAIPTLRRFDGIELTAEAHAALGDDTTKRWLLAIPPTYELEGALKEYVERYRKDVSKRHLPSQRTPWYSIDELPRPQLLLSPLSKGTFKVVINTADAVPSNNLFGITLNDQSDPARLAAWLRSDKGQQELRRLGRRYPGGSLKLEPRALRAAEVPAIALNQH